MDLDFWAARVHSAKHIPAVQLNNSGNHIFMEDEGSDEVGAWFPCPFCYMEIEVPLLCVHLQEEHCFDLKNAVCPICAANLGRDAIGHFTVQHAHSVKRRKKPQNSGFWSNNNNVSTNIAKDLRELSSFRSGNEPAHDPLLSPFLYTMPPPSVLPLKDESHKDVSMCLIAMNEDAEEQEDYEEKRQQAAFVRELLLSTIF